MPGNWVQEDGPSAPPQALPFTWVPLAVPATRIFTMAVISSRCFLSSSSSTWGGAGQRRTVTAAQDAQPCPPPPTSHRRGTHAEHHHVVADEVFHHTAGLVVLPVGLEERGPEHNRQVVCVHLVRV